MPMVFAIDPGLEQSACVLWDGQTVHYHNIIPNDEMLGAIAAASPRYPIAVEMVAGYGMPVGKEMFETCVWIGRFVQVAIQSGATVEKVYRKDVKSFLCGTTRAKDPNVRQALIDRHGPIGTKANPGPLHGVKGDEWAALGVAVFWMDAVR